MVVTVRAPLVLGLSLFFAVTLSAGCGTEEEPSDSPPESATTNVLVVILDDVGSVSMGAYADYWAGKSTARRDWTPARTAPAPTIEAICARGVRFTEAWSEPTCSPTRSSVLTGRLPFRTGVGEPCGQGSNELLSAEPTLPRIIEQALPEYGLANVGKWHLGTGEDKGGDAAPNTMGWEYFAGILGGVADYFEWARTEDGATSTVTDYATTRITDDAIAWLATLDAGQPWLLWVAYNAAHTPLHKPPADLHSYDDLPEEVTDERHLDYFEAMIEALDTELARLLATLPDTDGDDLPDDTLLIVLGDNGSANSTEARTLPAPFEGARAKGTVYEQGVRVPLCIAGEGVTSPGRDEDAFVHVVDLYRTILEAAGVPAETLPTDSVTFDSVSLTPYLQAAAHPTERQWLLSEQFSVEGSRRASQAIAIKDRNYKFVRALTDVDSGAYADECYAASNITNATRANLWQNDATATSACESLRTVALELVCSVQDSPHAAWCP